MVVSVIQISQKMKNKSFLSIEKYIIECEKTLYHNYKKVFYNILYHNYKKILLIYREKYKKFFVFRLYKFLLET